MKTGSLEYGLEQDDPLCFIRIPKTGSTTLVSILSTKFNSEEICRVPVADLPQAPIAELAKYRLFRDHFDYDIRDFLLKAPVYMTMLRHPLDRAISLYKFCQQGQSQTPFDRYMQAATAKGLRSFIDHSDPAIRIRTSNLQTRQIAAGLGCRHRHPFQPAAIESQLSDWELLSLAKAHLDEFKFVGLTERFQDSVLLLSYIFGWLPEVEYQSFRIAANKPRHAQISQDAIAVILSVNQLDLELYEYAQTRFEQAFNQMLIELNQKCVPSKNQSLRLLSQSEDQQRQFLLAQLEQHYEQRYAARDLVPQRSIDYTFSQAIAGSGWQRNPKWRRYTWTGSGTQSTLDFSLVADADLIIRIRIVNAVAPDVLASLTLKINEHLIPLETLVHQGNVKVLQGIIPHEATQNERCFTRLMFSVDRTLPLQRTNSVNTLERLVGVAFERIQIFPAATKLGDSAYLSLVFPVDDSDWLETANFLQNHLKTAEKLIAPGEFGELFPLRICSNSLSSISLFSMSDCPEWVLIHKGWIEAIEHHTLKQAIQTLTPVFANGVFVVFTTRQDLNPLSDRSPHVQSLWTKLSPSSSQQRWDGIKSKWLDRWAKIPILFKFK
jgi:hypothetical protein